MIKFCTASDMFCSTYGYSCICISLVVPTSTPASDKSRIRISPAVPTGTPVSDKVCLCISYVVPLGTPVSDKSRI